MHSVKFNTATEQLAKATEEVKSWREQTHLAEQHREVQEHNIKMLTQIILERDDDYRQEQERRTVEHNLLVFREKKSLRGDTEQREEFLGHVRSSGFKSE